MKEINFQISCLIQLTIFKLINILNGFVVYYYGVTRSKKTESDRDIRKARNVFTNLRFCGKRKDCTKQLTSILKLWHSHDYKSFCLQLVTFEMLNSSSHFGVDRHLL